MLTMALFSIGMLRYLESSRGAKIAAWKSICYILLFEFSFAPYAVLVSASHSVLKWVNLIWFLSVWMMFFFVRHSLPVRFSFVASIVFGSLLIEPVSSFVSISGNRLYFGFDNFHTIDLASSGLPTDQFLHILYRMAWAIFPMFGVHCLMKSVENEKADNSHAG
jgi:hypothetical protein